MLMNFLMQNQGKIADDFQEKTELKAKQQS
jgi:hypothetical protein